MYDQYIIEVRDNENNLDFEKWARKEQEYPYLFSKPIFSMEELCYFMSFGENRDEGKGPLELAEFMKSIGITYRAKTW